MLQRVDRLLKLLAWLKDARVEESNGIIKVTIGGVMEDWQKWELIKEFRREFKSSVITEHGSGCNISGEATIAVHF